jgi:hypothetical protein
MRPLLGLLLASALLLSGCGGGDDTAGEPTSAATSASSPTAPSSSTQAPPQGGTDAGATLLALISQSNVGGEVSTTAVPLDSADAVAEFSSQFEGSQMSESLQQALSVATVPDGQQLMGAVIAVGCSTPGNATVTRADDGSIVVTAKGGGKSTQECLVPVTTVALVAVPQADA